MNNPRRSKKTPKPSWSYRRCFLTSLAVVAGVSCSFFVSRMETASLNSVAYERNSSRSAPDDPADEIPIRFSGVEKESTYESLPEGSNMKRGPFPVKTTKRKRESTEVKADKKAKRRRDVDGEKHDPSDDNKSIVKPLSDHKITRIALLGERHCGTNWITAHLEKCFPSLRVTPRLKRWKHWFQDDDGRTHNQTLVIAQFRNAYEWVEAVRHIPHHAPNHVYLNWKDFVTKEWSTPRLRRDLELKDKEKVKCQNEGFQYHQVNSCVKGLRTDPEYLEFQKKHPNKPLYSGHKPIYEMKPDGTGKPFKNILELRAAKIQNHLSVGEWPWISASVAVQYETMVREGTDHMLKTVEGYTGIKRQCDAFPPQNRPSRKMKTKYVEWMTRHIDWEAEKLIGYKKWGEEAGEEIGEDENDVGLEETAME